MEPSERRRLRERSIALATAGFVLALGVVLVAKLLGLSGIGYRGWAVAVGVTLVVQAVLWCIPHFGWDERLTWDPHYLYIPMVAAAGLLNYFAWLSPSLRVLPLMAWFVALLFMAGTAGIGQTVVLSAVMAAGYLFVVTLLVSQGVPISPLFEALVAGVFLLISGYAGIVFDRLRRDRRDFKAMRRQLAELALTDALTDLPNRRHFEEILRSELDRIRRYGGRCTLAMIDVDNFKHYNDTLGHLAGDMALRELAAVMRKHLRLSDMLARYGGEEFGLIMVNASADEAYTAIDRLREVVAAYPFRDEHVLPSGHLTISAGIANCPEDATEYEPLVRAADRALYAAKRQGRNRVQTVMA